MNPKSQFIRTLNEGPDPGVPYTILAGDVSRYDEPSDPFFSRLIAKAGQSILFDSLFRHSANDIAVDVESIRTTGKSSVHAASVDVACHHLNYFSSEAGREALRRHVALSTRASE